MLEESLYGACPSVPAYADQFELSELPLLVGTHLREVERLCFYELWKVFEGVNKDWDWTVIIDVTCWNGYEFRIFRRVANNPNS